MFSKHNNININIDEAINPYMKMYQKYRYSQLFSELI